MLPDPLIARVADSDGESASQGILFATGFAGISDIEVSPYDGYMYVVSLGQGKIFRILPTADLDMSASGDSIPSVQLAVPEAIPPPPPPPASDEPVEDSDDDGDDQVSEDGSDEDGNGNNNNDASNGD